MHLTAGLPIAVGVAITSGLFLCQTTGPRVPAERSPRADLVAEVPPALAQLAQRVHDTYVNAKSIAIEARVVHAGQALTYRYEGTQRAFRTVAFVDGEVYGAFSFNNGRVQEYVPDHPARLVLCYDSEYDDQIPRLVHERPLDCQYGGAFALKVGDKAVDLALLRRRIEQGAYQGIVEVNGRPCHEVVSEKTLLNSADEPVRIRHIYRIDTAAHTVARYDTHQGDIVRQRSFTKVALNAEPPTDWDILPHVESLVASISQPSCEVTTTR